MADPDDKWDENVPGKFYVDRSCIICGLCAMIAPANICESDDGTHDYVFKQPSNDEEAAACEDALSQCPTGSIGMDGMESEA